MQLLTHSDAVVLCLFLVGMAWRDMACVFAVGLSLPHLAP